MDHLIDDADREVSVDTEPSADNLRDHIEHNNTIHRLDALTCIYKALCEGYGARTGRSETADAAIARLEAVIHGLVMALRVPADSNPPQDSPADFQEETDE